MLAPFVGVLAVPTICVCVLALEHMARLVVGGFFNITSKRTPLYKPEDWVSRTELELVASFIAACVVGVTYAFGLAILGVV